MTLRARLTWILLATLVPLGVAVGFGLYAFVRVSLYARLDDALAARAEALAAAVKWHNGALEFDFEDAAMPQYQAQPGTRSTQAAYFELWRMQGGELGPLIERSKSMGAGSLVSLRRLADRSRRPGTWNADLADGTDVRVLATRVIPAIEREDAAGDAPASNTGASGLTPNAASSSSLSKSDQVPEVLVAVAVPRETVDRPLELLALGLAIAGGVIAVAGFLSLRWAIAKGLAPVGELAEQVARIDAESLRSRLAAPRLPPEIAPIQDRVNALLVRIEGAMQREKRFTSAAAHELRTPIAELRMLLEVATSQQRTSDEWTQTADRAMGVLAGAQNLCEALLRLARAGENQIASDDLVELDVGTVLVEQARRAIASHGAEPGLVRVECAPGLKARVDRAMLCSIIANLLDNALRHGAATNGEPIMIRATQIQSQVALAISNPAPDISPEDLPHLFEPFWRKDPSRHDRSGFGLGLAVARTLARAMDGDISAMLDASGMLTIRLSLRSSGRDAECQNVRF